MITDEYRNSIHPEVEEYMRRYVTDEQNWEQVDDEDCWGMNYTGPTTEIKDIIESILHSWGEGTPRGTTGSAETTETRKRKVLCSTCI
jgi:hypothetical protein